MLYTFGCGVEQFPERIAEHLKHICMAGYIIRSVG